MKREWVQYLADPYDLSALRLEDSTERDGRVVTATLVSESGRRYPVRDGIPIFVTSDFQDQQSVASFGYEWDQWGFDFAKTGWLQDICHPLVGDPSFFAGKLCADCGAGAGAQTRWMAEGGAKLVFSLELSDTIFTRHKQTIEPFKERVFPIQCDIRYPPLRQKVDVLYCMNAIQHTADPRATFASLVERLLAPDGRFMFNIYTKRSEAKFKIVRGVRKLIRRLPFAVWKWFAFLITCFAWPLSRIEPLRQPLRVVVPISHSFKETWLDVYDAFGGHWYQENMALADQMKMFEEEALEMLRRTTYGYLLKFRG